MRRRMFVWFFILALLVRLGIAAKFGMFHWLERSEMEVIALNLVQFGNYGLYGGPTAHSTPVALQRSSTSKSSRTACAENELTPVRSRTNGLSVPARAAPKGSIACRSAAAAPTRRHEHWAQQH